MADGRGRVCAARCPGSFNHQVNQCEERRGFYLGAEFKNSLKISK